MSLLLIHAINEEDVINEESVKGHFFLLPDPDSFEIIF